MGTVWKWSALWEVVDLIPTREEMFQALVERQGRELTECFSRATVAVCGLGGLGSHIAMALARAGVGRLILIDDDVVDVSNLHRQQYGASQVGKYKTEALEENLRVIAPYIRTETHRVRLTEQNGEALLRGADVVCEAFDGAEDKAMLAQLVLEKLPESVLVAASGMAGLGSANTIRTRKITDRFYLCGDGVSDVADGIGLVAPRVMVCAGHQAQMTLRILAGEAEKFTVKDKEVQKDGR